MGQAVRAIIVEGENLLAMHRNKYGSQYFTLVGGRVQDGESLEDALKREVKEETGLDVTTARLVFTEQHPEPYNSQFIYLCEIGPHDKVAIADDSEEGMLNRLDANIHTPVWVTIRNLATIEFRTPQLHKALIDCFKRGFPANPVKL